MMSLGEPADESKVYEAIRAALAEARTRVAVTINSAMVQAYWEIGRQITAAVGERAEYGKSLAHALRAELSWSHYRLLM